MERGPQGSFFFASGQKNFTAHWCVTVLRSGTFPAMMGSVRKFAPTPALATSILLLLLFASSVPSVASSESGVYVVTTPSFVVPGHETKPQQKIESASTGFEFTRQGFKSWPDIAAKPWYTSSCLGVNRFSRNVFYVLASINAP